MAQNISPAVMNQRIEPHDSLDDFPTPSWGTRALIEQLKKKLLPFGNAIEPCCNRGYMARPLRETFANVWATDIFDYGWAGMNGRADFLLDGGLGAPFPLDWAFFNPPFVLAQEFIEQALTFVRVGCAALVRTAFLEGQDRYNELFRKSPPTLIYQFSERIILTKGIVRDPDVLYWDPEARDKKTGMKGAWKKPSTATSYAWLVWVPGMEREPLDWIPPSRKQLERPGDYDIPTLQEHP